MACLLRDLPCQLALVDRMDFANQQSSIDKDSEKFDPRVSALTAASKKLFTELGIWAEVEERR